MRRPILHAAGFAAIVGLLGFLLAHTLDSHQETRARASKARAPFLPSYFTAPDPRGEDNMHESRVIAPEPES